MAFRVLRKDPVENINRRGLGVKLPFNGTAVFNSTYTSKEAIKTNILNYFLTGRGERVLNPDFGFDLRSKIFEFIDQDSLDTLRKEVRNKMNIFFPRVKIITLEVSGTPDENLITFFLKYSVEQTDIEDEINITFE